MDQIALSFMPLWYPDLKPCDVIIPIIACPSSHQDGCLLISFPNNMPAGAGRKILDDHQDEMRWEEMLNKPAHKYRSFKQVTRL